MLGLAFLQAPPLARKRMWRDLAAFGALWLIAMTYGTLVFAGVPVPKPLQLVTTFLEGHIGKLGAR